MCVTIQLIKKTFKKIKYGEAEIIKTKFIHVTLTVTVTNIKNTTQKKKQRERGRRKRKTQQLGMKAHNLVSTTKRSWHK